MSLYKRKDSPHWWIKLHVNGRRLQESTGTADRKRAQELHDKLKAELWEQSRLGVKPGYSWQQAVLRWLDDTEEKASRRDDINRLRWLHVHLEGVMLSEVDRYKLDAVISAKKGEGASNATINRHLAIVRSILRKAVHEWGWLDSMPKVRMLPEPKQRIRFLTKDEAERLLAELPAHLADMVRFSLETGLRQANVTGLLWNQLDLVRKVAWIHPDQAKARKAIAVPLSDVAVEIIRRQLGKHHTHVFSYRGQSVSRVNNHAWTKALGRAGIENFRWHDLRHTWASWHVQRGTPLHVLQELGGWESVEMVKRYAHLSGEHLAQYVTSMTGCPRRVVTNRLRSETKKG
ncbi:tyrosine-type recombinase/integrase [Methylococcus mesophilus]|uniref:tyrosine-type recombinase/integrase n=1 Tax=Methylococcus mesophilus TaxID=2993564 RepID=UPI00224B0691|nr:site-specific integrase [Methylococcus mesophilus]UZR30718.1 site-specific integrase [Methylococcus mesophilus]